jgi:FtsP/CotA-like multicopper oxidase with cupredoxin domain
VPITVHGHGLHIPADMDGGPFHPVNASAARIYRPALSGHRLLQVGTDGGLFEHPELDEILLTVGERAELLVRAGAAPGTRATLQTLPYDRYVSQTKCRCARPLGLVRSASPWHLARNRSA